MLTEAQTAMLAEIIQKRELALLHLVRVIGTRRLHYDERESLREVLATELVETGLGEASEPNKRGLLIEDIIDALGDA
jgi:hypothetical protein